MSYYDSRQYILLEQKIDISSMWAGSNQLSNELYYDGQNPVNIWGYTGDDALALYPLMTGAKPLQLWRFFLEVNDLTGDTITQYDWAAAKQRGVTSWYFDSNGPVGEADFTFCIQLIYQQISGNDRFFLVGHDMGSLTAWQYHDRAELWCAWHVTEQITNLFYGGHDPESALTINDAWAATMWLMAPQKRWTPDYSGRSGIDYDNSFFLCMHGSFHQKYIADDGMKYNDFSGAINTSDKIGPIYDNFTNPEEPVQVSERYGGYSGYFPGVKFDDINFLPYYTYAINAYTSGHVGMAIPWHSMSTLPMVAYTIETSDEDTEPSEEEIGGDGDYIQDDVDQDNTNIPEDDGDINPDGDDGDDEDGDGPGPGTRTSDGGGASDTGMVHLYAPTPSQMKVFSTQMWTDNFITAIRKMFEGDPINSIISLGYLPMDFAALGIRSAGTTNCIVGVYDTAVPMHYVTNKNDDGPSDYVSLDCGYVDIAEKWGGAIDFDPYSSCEVYLPFIGFVKVSMSDILTAQGKGKPGRLYLSYNVNLFTGDCVALLRGTGVPQTKDSKLVKHLIGQYCGNCMEQIPFTGANYAAYYKNLGASLGGLGAAAVGVATGNFMMAGAAAASSIMNSMTCPPQMQRSGSFSGGSSRLQHLQPFVRLTRPAQSLAQKSESEDIDKPGYKNFEGRSCNYYVDKLSSKSGFTMIKSIKLNGIGATEDEMKEIDSLLKAGVFI